MMHRQTAAMHQVPHPAPLTLALMLMMEPKDPITKAHCGMRTLLWKRCSLMAVSEKPKARYCLMSFSCAVRFFRTRIIRLKMPKSKPKPPKVRKMIR